MKQTAVEYIKEKLICDEYWYENMTFEQIFEQAKAMYIENIKQAYNDGKRDAYRQDDVPTADEYVYQKYVNEKL
jgi:hypothetical protein